MIVEIGLKAPPSNENKKIKPIAGIGKQDKGFFTILYLTKRNFAQYYGALQIKR